MLAISKKQKAMSRKYHNPVKVKVVASLYSLSTRLLAMAPMSLLMAMLLMLVGFSMATGYLVMERKAKPQQVLIPLSSSHFAPPSTSQPDTPSVGQSITPPSTCQPAAPGADQSAAKTASTNSSPDPEVSVVKVGNNTTPRFAVALGAYVQKRTFEDEKQLAEAFDQPFYIKISDKKVTMTRLYVGTYPTQKAIALLKKVQKVAPDAFLVKVAKGQMASVYGGSFYYRVDTEKRQKLLAKKGFATKEVSSKETMPIYSVYIGNFESQQKASEFIHTAGLSQAEAPLVASN